MNSHPNNPKVACGHCGQELVTLGNPCRECSAITSRDDQGNLSTSKLVVTRIGRRLLSDRIFDAVITIGVSPFA